jgi:hypothetical protein
MFLAWGRLRALRLIAHRFIRLVTFQTFQTFRPITARVPAERQAERQTFQTFRRWPI